MVTNFLEAGFFYIYDCIVYKSFKRVGFSILPLNISTVFAHLIFQAMHASDFLNSAIVITLFLLANMIVPLLKVVTVKRSIRETVLLLFRGVWRTAVIMILAMFVLDPIVEGLEKLIDFLNYFGVIYTIALIFSLTDAVAKTLMFFSDFASAERTIKRLNDVQERRDGFDEVFQVFEEETMERAALDESIIKLKDYPPRFFILYDWILAWRFPKAFSLWKKH